MAVAAARRDGCRRRHRRALRTRRAGARARGLWLGETEDDGLTDGDTLDDGDTLALGETDGLTDADGLTEADGETLGDSLLDGLTDALGDTDGDSLLLGDTDALGETDGDSLLDGDTEADGLTLGDSLLLGLTEADGLTLGETLGETLELPPKVMSSVNSTHGLSAPVAVSFSARSVAESSPKEIDAARDPADVLDLSPISNIRYSPELIETSENGIANVFAGVTASNRRLVSVVVNAGGAALL
jgi:hypothetical protein